MSETRNMTSSTSDLGQGVPVAASQSFVPMRSPESVPARMTAVDLFAGAGGASLGLTRAGYDLRLSAEIDPLYAATHELNLPGAVLEADLRRVNGDTLLAASHLEPAELDLLFAGPPCQGFSMIGPRVVWDQRNNLYLEVLRAVDALRPRAVVIENVPGLTTLAGGRYLAEILEGLRSHGYQASCGLMLAAQFGAPQMRWRLIIIAWRNDLGIEAGYGFPSPTHGTAEIGDLLPNVSIPLHQYNGFLTTRDAIGDLPGVEAGGSVDRYLGSPVLPYQTTSRTDVTGKRMSSSVLFDHYAPALAPKTLERIRALRPGQDWRDLPVELLPASMQRALRKDHTRRYRRMTWDGTPRAIITRFRDPKSGEYTHPSQDRTITIREAARIQGFPDWFAFSGPNTSKYMQVGNAVPVPLAQAIAAEVRTCLLGDPASPRLQDPFRRQSLSFLGRHGELVAAGGSK